MVVFAGGEETAVPAIGGDVSVDAPGDRERMVCGATEVKGWVVEEDEEDKEEDREEEEEKEDEEVRCVREEMKGCVVEADDEEKEEEEEGGKEESEEIGELSWVE